MTQQTQLAIAKLKDTLQKLSDQSPCLLSEQAIEQKVGDYEISIDSGDDYAVIALTEIADGHKYDVMDICLLVQDGEIQTMCVSNLKLSANLISASDIDCEVAKKYSLAERIVRMYVGRT